MAGFCFGMGFALCSFSCGTATAVRFLHLFKFGLVVLERCNASRRRAAVEKTPARFFVDVATSLKLLSTCSRSKPLLARGQRALRAYVAIGESLFVQARQSFANIAKLLCSYLFPLSLGAFALLLRSLVVCMELCVGIGEVQRLSEASGSREDSRSFFCGCCHLSKTPFNLFTQQASARSWAKGSASLCRYWRRAVGLARTALRQHRQTTL